jgi:hypothetical protein
MENREIAVKPPEKCPGCGMETCDGGILGEPHIWTIEDVEMDAEFVIVKGWFCDLGKSPVIFGTVIRYGPLENPVDLVSEDHVYIMDLPGRSFFT